MSNVTHPSNDAHRGPPRRRLWLWFLAEFLIYFLGLALVYPMHFYDGRSVRPATLGQYYILEIRRALTSTGNLGPASGNRASLLTAAVTHVIISVITGSMVMSLGWVTRPRNTEQP